MESITEELEVLQSIVSDQVTIHKEESKTVIVYVLNGTTTMTLKFSDKRCVSIQSLYYNIL